MSQENKSYRIVTGPESIQGSSEWLAFRKGKISASIAPVIMGVSPWQTPLQLWEEIVLGKTKEKTAAMERGSRMEEEAREWLIGLTGIPYQPVVIQSISNPEFIASLDGYHEDENGKVFICEIKCPGIMNHSKALEGNIPDYYFPQLQHQMNLANVESMSYLSYYPGTFTEDSPSGMILKCERDEKYCKDLNAQERAFFASILDLNPPEPQDKDWVKVQHPIDLEMSLKYRHLLETKEFIENSLENLKTEIISRCLHPRTMMGGLKIQQITRKGTIDYKKIFEDYQIQDSEKYRKPPIQSWRIQW